MTVIERLKTAMKHGLVRALMLSLAALAVPVVGTFLIPEARSDYEALLWLVALVPAFLLAYHKGWRGVATSLAAGMAVLSVTYAVAESVGRAVPDLLFGVVTFYIVFTLMVGWLAERFHRDVKRERFEGSAFTDNGTGLPNRKHAELHLDIEFSAAQRGRPLSVVMLGLEHFKAYTTRHGVIAADEVLRLMAATLRKTTRRSNLSARYSEDEFICVLGGTDDDGALAFVARFHQILNESGSPITMPPLSAGIAAFRSSIRSGAELIAAAHDSLKRARKDGAGRVRVYGRAVIAPTEMASAAPGSPEPHRSVMPQGRGNGRRALVVVEETPVRALLARYLNDHGFNVAQVSNVVDGVQCLSIEYEVLITDISLVEGLGAELVRAAKLRWPSIQVLGLAHGTENGAAIDALNAGVDRYIQKPLDLHKLRTHITELLARHDRLVSSVLESRQLSLEVQAEKAEAVIALRRSEEEYRSVVESLQEIIFRLDPAGVITFLNWAWSSITNDPVDEALDHPLLKFVLEADRARLSADLAALMAGELDESRSEVRLEARDGGIRWVELRARRTFNTDGEVSGATGTMDDITRRKQTEELLRRTEAASRAILAALPDHVFGLRRDGVFISYEAGEAPLDIPVGKTLEQVFPADIAQKYRQALKRLDGNRDVQVLEYEVDLDGVTNQYEARLAIASDEEAVAIVRNISDRSRLEEQLRQSHKLEAIGRLAGGLAHDFNNLLTVVQGNAHMLIDEFGNNNEAREFAMQINSAADRGADLVRQLLAFGRKQVMQPRDVNLNAVVYSVQGLLPKMVGDAVVLQLDLDDNLGLVRADPGQIEHVLMNLAAFIKARLPQGGRLRVTTRNVNADLDYDPSIVNLEREELVLLTLEDNGPPLDEQTRTHVFEPFFGTVGMQTHASLGLATVYGIINQTGGTILLDDGPTGGARFQIYIPRVDGR